MVDLYNFDGPITVLVCGGRDFDDYDHLEEFMDELNDQYPIARIVHGDAKGADRLAGEWAQSRRIDVSKYPANWKEHGNAAGPIRNRLMLDMESPDLVVAFPGSRGTQNMIDQAEGMGVPVINA